jgi:hypothetical protein
MIPIVPHIGPRAPAMVQRQLYAIENPSGGVAGGSIMHPFQLIDASDGAGANIKVRYGTVSDVVPTLDGDSLSISPVHTIGSAGTFLVYLEVSYDDDGTITSVTVEVGAGPLPSFDDNTDYKTLGEVDVATVESVLAVTEIRQAVTHSLEHGICGRVIEEGSITTPGTPYFWGV